MTDAPTPRAAETQSTEVLSASPVVKVLMTTVDGADLAAALAVVGRQVYAPIADVVVVGGESGEIPDGVTTADSLEEAIKAAGDDIDFLWILHSDARPRPDALGALVTEVELADAALGGSKLLVAGTGEELEAVGSSTDVFGEPHSGLDEGEIDLQQYDVVREVAFVRSASMLVRRDLAQGLRGLDEFLPPIAAGLDFSQRARLAGGRVISVPSSEVYHQGRCNEHGHGWREQAGRLRAMVTSYSPLTLLWLIPYDFIVSVLDSLLSLLLLRWRPAARYVFSWGWNAYHLPSTIGLRRRFRPVRLLGDEELFRFQARGSVRLRAVGSELAVRILSMFDEDQAIARGTRRVRGSSGIWGAAIAVIVLAFAMRSLIFIGVPNVGASFPFEEAATSLDRWFAGWNDSGLGSPTLVHPSVGVTGLWSWLWLGAEGAARTFLTIAFGFLAVVGMGRLAGRLGYRGAGRYLSGLVLLAGPGTAILAGSGSWLALAAAATLPWTVRAVFVHPDEVGRGRLSHIGWVVLLGIPLAAFSPLLAIVPLLSVIVWKLSGGKDSSFGLALVGLLGAVVAVPFILGDTGWVLDSHRRLGLSVAELWPVLLAVGFTPMVFIDSKTRRLGTLGAVLGLSGLLAVGLSYGGPGVEEAALVLASFGTALIVATGLDVVSSNPRRLMGALVSVIILFLSIGVLGNGRLGLPGGDFNERIEFASALADDAGPGRILVASTQREDIPGEARPGPGFWYRLVDGQGMTSDEVWLPTPLPGDHELDTALERISSGGELRPGKLLAPFAIDWLILLGPTFRLDEGFVAQLDLVPTPLEPDSRVFANPVSAPLADSGTESVWLRSGTGFVGEPGSGRVSLAVNHDDGWSPEPGPHEWRATVSAVDGVAGFRGTTQNMVFAVSAAALLLVSMVLLFIARRRR
ncbi:MAG: glycosyltransferase [Acidimicrobiia bacterium]